MSPQQTIAHYRITAKLGQGGMGAASKVPENANSISERIVGKKEVIRINNSITACSKSSQLPRYGVLADYSREVGITTSTGEDEMFVSGLFGQLQFNSVVRSMRQVLLRPEISFRGLN
jgi:hypothetical protein